MTSNQLKLNSTETELMVVALTSLLQMVLDLLLTVNGSSISPFSEGHNLGIILLVQAQATWWISG